MKDNSVSIAKAIAILLMVLAHTQFSKYGSQWINMFHMPLFFFFAGYCFKDKYLETPSDFVIKRVKGLYKPFVKWSLIFLVLHNLSMGQGAKIDFAGLIPFPTDTNGHERSKTDILSAHRFPPVFWYKPLGMRNYSVGVIYFR